MAADRYIMLTLLLLNYTSLCAQDGLTQLKVGDTLPELKFSYRQNGQVKNLSTSELKNKLVILDFWNIWCSSCIALMPEMKNLMNEFPDDLQILLVTDNSDQQVRSQFAKIDSRSAVKPSKSEVLNTLPSVTGDRRFHLLFPHISVPHHVWIKNGKVLYITGGANATSKTVAGVLKGKDIRLSEKKDTAPFDLKAPLYLEGNGRLLPNLKYYAMIYKEAGEFQNRRFSEETDTAKQVYRFKCINFTLPELFRQATLKTYKRTLFAPNRLVLKVKDSTAFFWPKDLSKAGEWRIQNLYCFDLAMPISNKELTPTELLDQISRLLPYSAKIETRLTDCLALTVTGENKTFVSMEIAPDSINYQNGFYIRNGTIADLISKGLSGLNESLSTPIVNATEYEGKTTIHLSSRSDLPLIRKELQQYGLDLVARKISIEMLVIQDN